MDNSPFKKFQKRKQTKEKGTTVYLDRRAEEEEEEEVTPKPRSTANKVGVIIGALVAVPVGFMLLWNWLMPAIFGLPLIGYFKSWGLLLMSIILFKNVKS
jgi:hypothetical protein|tara:strand:- start:104 stop:403 length:300 start_codon:yes stop_codon:yes gene_type:complete